MGNLNSLRGVDRHLVQFDRVRDDEILLLLGWWCAEKDEVGLWDGRGQDGGVMA